ncbi:MAG: FMN-binding protein [Bacilli bacterium]|nr:FMN-binding protein [Bacilli bacterium]
MKKIITLALFLAVVAGISGGALSFVNDITAPIISEAAIAAEKENLVKIYPSAEFKALEPTDLSDYSSLNGVYEAVGTGYVYKCSVVGYGGASTPIVYLVALDNDGTYKGYEVIDCSGETSGFGSKVAEADFTNSIVGKNIGDSIDTIAGATISSSAVVNGISEAVAHWEANYK